MGDETDTVGALWEWCVTVIGRGAYEHRRRDRCGESLSLGAGGKIGVGGAVGAITVVNRVVVAADDIVVAVAVG